LGARALTHQQWLGQIQGAISVKMAHSCAGDGAMWGEKMVRNDEHTMDIASKKIQKYVQVVNLRYVLHISRFLTFRHFLRAAKKSYINTRKGDGIYNMLLRNCM
jgi:predicted solute-binding protein